MGRRQPCKSKAKRVPDRWNNKDNGPEVKESMDYLKIRKESSVPGGRPAELTSSRTPRTGQEAWNLPQHL